MSLIHTDRYHNAVHNMTHVVELVEDMRPCVHIFFVDIFPPIFALVVIAGVIGFGGNDFVPTPKVYTVPPWHSAKAVFAHHGAHKSVSVIGTR